MKFVIQAIRDDDIKYSKFNVKITDSNGRVFGNSSTSSHVCEVIENISTHSFVKQPNIGDVYYIDIYITICNMTIIKKEKIQLLERHIVNSVFHLTSDIYL